MHEPHLTTSQVAALAGVHPRTIAVRAKERGISPAAKIGSAFLWSAKDAALLAEYRSTCNRWDSRFAAKKGRKR